MQAPSPDDLLVEPQHGVDGWSLAWYAWNEATGHGVFEYERGELRQRVDRLQPAGPQHEGWGW